MIVFELKQWEGEYETADIAHGVRKSPTRTSIYVVPADGSAPPRHIPVKMKGNVEYPQFSGDGRWLHFQAKRDGHWHLFRCLPDGAGLENLTESHTPPGDRFGYAFSRDGTRIVFTYNDGKVGRVAMMNADGTKPALVAPDLGYHYMADISPDNESVVFAHAAEGYTLERKRLDAGTLTALTPGLKACFVPRFTRDGKVIIFFRRGGDIYCVSPDGSGLRRLTEGNAYDTFYLSPADKHGSTDGPDISPDGKRLAYIAKKGNVSQVFVMNLDGTHQQQLTHRETPCGRVAFSPDGEQIAFVSWVDETVQLFVVDSDGGTPQQLTDVQGAVYRVAWRP